MEMKVNVWGRSPSPPAAKKGKESAKAKAVKEAPPKEEEEPKASDDEGREVEEAPKKESRRRSRSRSPSASKSSSSDSSDSDSSSESSGRKRKSKRKRDSKRKKSKKESKHKKSKKSKRRRSRSSSSESESEGGDEFESKKHKSEPAASGAPSHEPFDELDQEEAAAFRLDVQGRMGQAAKGDSESDEEAGPMPMVKPKEYKADMSLNYGNALMPGEGDAIAQFVQQNLRIPRRGEIGWQGGEIESLQDEGYVMSGSRHARMNAVRLRKENQVYTAEEKRALALITFEEQQQKENKVVGDFRAMLTKQLGEGAAGPEPEE